MRRRKERLDSLLREVVSEVINNEIKSVRKPKLISITSVDISLDLRSAKVMFSVIGSKEEKKEAQDFFNSNVGLISKLASKKVCIRFFPSLVFKLDESIENIFRINELLDNLK